MMEIEYVKGDATAPAGDGQKIIVHVCNDLGKWGKGFVLAISRHWKAPEKAYRAAYTDASQALALGDVQFVQVDDSITVANMIGQHGIKRQNSKAAPPIRYSAIRQGLQTIADYALEHQASIHMPRIGCGLAGGKWEEIETLIGETLLAAGVSVVVYDY